MLEGSIEFPLMQAFGLGLPFYLSKEIWLANLGEIIFFLFILFKAISYLLYAIVW
jgi:hypothetical protein|tara:strand:+ start:1448 stop:1612 length:165 start_codon:yes stop_codon:yes gene_type:complete